MTRLGALVALALWLGGCAMEGAADFPSCASDEQCQAGQVCYPDGCGDPGKNIRVEVTPNVRTGHHAQDFELIDLRPEQNLEVFGPSTMEGVLQRTSGVGTVATSPYASPVTFHITGESTLIPGLVRRFQSTLTPDRGLYSVSVGAGRYSTEVLAADTSVPPLSQPSLVIQPGESPRVDFVLPASADLYRVDGRLLESALSNTAVLSAEMEVQALDLSMKPLSQRARVSSGQPASTGDFQLFIDPSVRRSTSFLIQATPRDSAALVPTKLFTVTVDGGLKGPLDLGDFGTAVTSQGQLLSSNGAAVTGATVWVEGKVGGGGTHRSARVQTDATGQFTLATLPSATDSSFILRAIPPLDSAAGMLESSVKVSSKGGSLGSFTCPDRVEIRGVVLRPGGSDASEVRVVAEPLSRIGSLPLPATGAETSSDEFGRFSLRLDPAVYRLDFIPDDQLPRASRFVTVRPLTPLLPVVKPEPLDLGDVTLSKGTTVSGIVTGPVLRTTANERTPLPYATVRFYRILTVEQTRSSVLIGEGISDPNGKYQLVLPAR